MPPGSASWCAPAKRFTSPGAIELGRNAERASELKKRLASSRQSSLLFDTRNLVRELENLYRGMWEEFQAGRRSFRT